MDKENNKGIFSLIYRLTSGMWWKKVTQEDLETIIDTVQETGVLDEDENEMIHRIFEMKTIVAREIMVPRTDIQALEVGSPVEDVAKLVVDAGHSRLPVYKGVIDKVVGVVYAKDLLRFWVNKGENIKLADLMRQPLFVPETKIISDLLKEMKKQRVHIATVVDEYGGTSGLITIEDILEEIVGDIQDEYDLEEEEFLEAGEGRYLVDARMDIDELSEKLGIEIPKEDFDTLGGFLAHMLNKIPAVNEKIDYGNMSFTISEADERRISRVEILVNKEKKPKATPEKEC
ncbi:MAG: HlyC/CorC family transporter [Proteobacteria bacterium]|nr:HlyC/CorC family transporter [Pseudomonadota bacterium]